MRPQQCFGLSLKNALLHAINFYLIKSLCLINIMNTDLN